MQFRPREHEAKLTPAHAAVGQLKGVNSNLRAAYGVSGMEMGRAEVVEEHGDRDPEEAADRRHPGIVRARGGR
jgi:hypothetical protein